MRRYSIMLLALILLAGCKHKSHSLASQVLRSNGILNVIAKSDVQGTINSVAGENPHVLFHFGESNAVVIEQTQITVRGELWGEIPEETKKVLVQFDDNEFQIELDPKP